MKLTPGIKITLIYFVIGMLWIYLSDRILFIFFDYQDESKHILFQNIKGFFYITVTAALLYLMIRSFYRSQDLRVKQLELKQDELDQIRMVTSAGSWEYDFTTDRASWSSYAVDFFEDADLREPTPGLPLVDRLSSSEDREKLMDAMQLAKETGTPFDLRLNFSTATGAKKWVRFSGKRDQENGIFKRIYGSFQDITHDELSAQKISKLNRLYDLITQINRALVREKDELSLFQSICEITVTTGQFRMAWIGQVNPDTLELDVSACAGEELGYLSMMRKVIMKDVPEGRGPTGSALRMKTHFVCHDIATDPRMALWRDAQLERGYRSSIALPIFKFGEVAGAFTIYSATAEFFDNEEVELLKDATADISNAFEKLSLEQMRRNAEARVLEALDRYDMITMATSDTIWDWDIVAGTVYYNKGIHSVFGYGREQVMNDPAWREQNIHPNDRSSVLRSMQDIFAVHEQKFHSTYRFRCADGRYKIVSDRYFVRYDPEGRPVRVTGTMQDITREREYESRVEKAIVRTQEAERQQVGMELHDNVNQILAASLIYMGVAKEDLKKGKDITNDIQLSENYVREAVAEIRRLSHQLAPVSLKDVSILEAFEKLLSTVNAKKLFRVDLNLDSLPPEILTNDMKINMYRILQEQLNNIIKYAKASEIYISLSLIDNMISFSVADNGRGFDPKVRSGGIGIENMRRRARLMSGEFRINSAPGHGCEVVVEIPFSSDVDNNVNAGSAMPVS